MELIVLGIAQDGGLPHLGCDRACCVGARRTGRRLTPACLGIHDPETGGLLLIEATPEVEAQTARLHRLTGTGGRGRRPVDGILLTHAHLGHYLGLAHLGREAAAADGIELYVSPAMHTFLGGNRPWSRLFEEGRLRSATFEPGRPFAPLPGLEVTAINVPHRDEDSDTVAFRLRGPRRTVLFLPDVDRWGPPPGLLAEVVRGVDVAYLDGTFHDAGELEGRDPRRVPHPTMVETMALLERESPRPGAAVRFLHLNHTNQALHDPELRAALRRRGFGLAEEGERLEL